MANTYSQIYIQIVFAVKGRENLLQKPWREDVFKYMAAIVKGKNQKPIIINGVEDHVHLFIGLKPAMSVSDLGKASSNENIQEGILGVFAAI
jgi:putative transposase